METRFALLALYLLLSVSACNPNSGSPFEQPVADTRPPAETVAGAESDGPDGAALYSTHCQQCHEGTVSKAPPTSMLAIISASSILTSLESGVMKTQGQALGAQGRRAVAEYITGGSVEDSAADLSALACADGASEFDFSAQPDAKGWGVSYGNQRSVSTEVAGMTKDDLARLRLDWVFAFPNAIRSRSQPATAGGALYVGSPDGTVYSLDQKTGCIRWTYRTLAEVRTSIVVESWGEDASENHPKAYFGDLLGSVHAVDAVTGDLIWKDRPDDHPSLTLTATPMLFEGRLYVPMSSLEVTAAADPAYACCTFRGGLAVYDAASGEKLWTTYSISTLPREVGKNAMGTPRIAPSGAPIWGVPAIDTRRRRIYAGTGENYSSPADDSSDAVIAFDLDDGKLLWKNQMTPGDAWNMSCEDESRINCPPEDGPDLDIGAAIILATTKGGKDIILVGQKSGDVMALDPDADGKTLWRRNLGRGGIQGGVHFGMAVTDDVLFVPVSDFEAQTVGSGKARPGLYALNIENGELLWSAPAQDICDGREFCQPGLSAAASAIPGAVLAGAMDGHLRAYDSATGEVIWDFDTAREFASTGGGQALGGSIGGAVGPVFKDGMMYINSGYGLYFHMPGNALLAFSLGDSEGAQ